MALKCGIIGLPNVGKSTLFNALTASMAAAAANYPFCTIEPNSGTVTVPDQRLQILQNLANSVKVIPTYINFVDIAGLVKGASKGEGLGNKFLSHIREVDAVIHVLRCFEDDDITHVHNKIDPLFDAEIIETELVLADLESVEKRLISQEKRLKAGDKTILEQIELLKRAQNLLNQGKPVRELVNETNKKEIAALQLITSKPILYVCNVLESEAAKGNAYSQKIINKATLEGNNCVIISSKIEAEISQLESEDEKKEFLASLGLETTGLHKIIKAAYNLLNLRSFFTIGPKEAHGWTFEEGTLAPKAAGIIHSDFEKGFIRAEVISYNDYIVLGGEAKARETGKMRLEGKEYKMQDGDIVNFRFNV